MADKGNGNALPRGPHGLTREQVESSQRRRLIAAMTKVVGERGYVKTSVAEVIKEAGVSRATFYMLFRDKEQCFIEGLESATDEIGAAMVQAMLESDETLDDGTMFDKVDALIRIYLHVLSTYPTVAKTFLVEIYAVGPRAVRHRRAFMERFFEVIKDTILDGVEMTEERHFAIDALLHSMSSMVTLATGAGEIETLPSLREPFIALVRQVLATDLFRDVVGDV